MFIRNTRVLLERDSARLGLVKNLPSYRLFDTPTWFVLICAYILQQVLLILLYHATRQTTNIAFDRGKMSLYAYKHSRLSNNRMVLNNSLMCKELIRLALTCRSCRKQLMHKATELILQQNTYLSFYVIC